MNYTRVQFSHTDFYDVEDSLYWFTISARGGPAGNSHHWTAWVKSRVAGPSTEIGSGETKHHDGALMEAEAAIQVHMRTHGPALEQAPAVRTGLF